MESLYDSQGYAVNTVAVDAVLFTVINSHLCVFTSKRTQEVGTGLLALPGRFVDLELTPEEAIDEELKLITMKRKVSYFEQLGVAGSPNRDPRKRIISVNYFGIVPFDKNSVSQLPSQISEGEFGWVNVDTLEAADLFADHFSIINNARERLANKMEYSLIGINFLDKDCFTANDIYQIYSVVWDEKLDLPNFRRKLLNNKNVASISGRRVTSVIPKLAKTSQAYAIVGDIGRVSTRPVLHPPILRKD